VTVWKITEELDVNRETMRLILSKVEKVSAKMVLKYLSGK
jgi:hypothetical protein